MTAGTERRLAAIVCADVVGFARLMGSDEAGTLQRLKAHRAELIDGLIDRHGGRIVKTTGDGLLLEFASVVAAAECAIAMQNGMAARLQGVPEDQAIRFRVGVHLGDVIVDGDDIFGDGVNIAARLQEIGTPGGVTLSANAHDSVSGRVQADFADRGKRTLKNIAKPVHVWGWSSGIEQPVAPAALPDKPAIAVLPFDNMSGDPDQDFFSDGITEDIITELSRFPDLFVIARNSVFTYKGRAVKAQDVGRDLGVHYILEGSVRKAGDRVRVTAQLIAADTGTHLWAERYDRKLVDIFDFQDELTQSIVGILPGRLRSAERERLIRKPTSDMAAFDYLLAGRIHHHRATKQDNAAALALLSKAIDLDPRFAEAYAWKACALGQAIEHGFSEDLETMEEEAIAAIGAALSIDENNAECHRLLCEVIMEQHQLDQAKIHGDRALAMNPNDPRVVAQQGEFLTWLGRPEEGIEWIRKADRLDPLDIDARAHLLGRALYGCRRYAEAIDAYRQKTAPRYGHLAELAACYAQIDRLADAQDQAAAVLRLRPTFSIDRYLSVLSYREPADRDHLKDGLTKAGLPA
jgi:adenylate cyclase